MRSLIQIWDREDRLSNTERAYLLSALLYSVCYVSNTSGVFKAFHHGWGGRTGTALYRIRSTIEVHPPVLWDNGHTNHAAREDSRSLVPRLPDLLGRSPDVVYIDPPYNQHRYGSNYHVLNFGADLSLVPSTFYTDGEDLVFRFDVTAERAAEVIADFDDGDVVWMKPERVE